MVRRIPLSFAYFRTCFKTKFKDYQLQEKASERLDKEMDLVRIIKILRSHKIVQKVVLQKFQISLLDYNKQGFICLKQSEEDSRERSEWSALTTKMRNFRMCVDDFQ